MTDRTYEERTHKAERWDAYTTETLRTCYDDPGPSDEFHDAATGLLIRNVADTDSAAAPP